MVVPPAPEPPTGSSPPQLFSPPPPGPTTWTVAELSAHLSRLLAVALPGDLWVQGQMRNLSRPESGHVYFDLVEPAAAGEAVAAALSVVLLAPEKRMVNDVLRRTGGAVRMVDGIEVRIQGRVRWWAPRGQLQLRMTSIDPAWTLGRLAADREVVLAALGAEGLIDRNRSQPMPVVPLRVGLVTSVGSAAHADFLAELRSSSYGFDVVVADARTQGLDCERSVVSALRALTAHASPVDLVALVRGGGARTDLAAFDRAGIARAIAEMNVPVLTGIGHETDLSIADLVAQRAFKPRPRSPLISWSGSAVSSSRRTNCVPRRPASLFAPWCTPTNASAATAAASPVRRAALADQERTCDDAGQRLRRDPARALDRADQTLTGLEARVRAHDPVRVLARGWSITHRRGRQRGPPQRRSHPGSRAHHDGG